MKLKLLELTGRLKFIDTTINHCSRLRELKSTFPRKTRDSINWSLTLYWSLIWPLSYFLVKTHIVSQHHNSIETNDNIMLARYCFFSIVSEKYFDLINIADTFYLAYSHFGRSDFSLIWQFSISQSFTPFCENNSPKKHKFPGFQLRAIN